MSPLCFFVVAWLRGRQARVTKLARLDLSNNHITDRGARYLAKAAFANPLLNLTTVNLTRNMIDNAAVKLLQQLVKVKVCLLVFSAVFLPLPVSLIWLIWLIAGSAQQHPPLRRLLAQPPLAGACASTTIGCLLSVGWCSGRSFV